MNMLHDGAWAVVDALGDDAVTAAGTFRQVADENLNEIQRAADAYEGNYGRCCGDCFLAYHILQYTPLLGAVKTHYTASASGGSPSGTVCKARTRRRNPSAFSSFCAWAKPSLVRLAYSDSTRAM